MNTREDLQRIPLFRHLSARRLDRLLAASTTERYGKGQTIFRQGERARSIWIVVEGWAHLVRSASGDGASRAVVIFTITTDEMLCGISAIESGTYIVSAVAGTACRLVRFPGAIFREALTHEPRFAYQVVHLCARRIQHIAQQYGSMAEPVSNRIIRSILRLHQQFGSTLPLPHRELAQMSWTTTESAIRIVRSLKQQGLVMGTRGRLTIRRPSALEQRLTQADSTQGGVFLNTGRGQTLTKDISIASI
jgi:CRP-like cAMP-binding protein